MGSKHVSSLKKKFLYWRKIYRLYVYVLNMDLKHDSRQTKKFVYSRSIYTLSVLKMGSNMSRAN